MVIPSAIATQVNVTDAANHENQLTKAVIGANEGATEAITKKVGTRVINTVLCTSNGIEYKSIDKFELHLLVATILGVANRPHIHSVW